MLFAYSTMIAWSYYGLEGWIYLFGPAARTKLAYNAIFCATVVLGSSASLGAILDFADAMVFAMAVANLFALYWLAPVVRSELDGYRSRLRSGGIRRRGEADSEPVKESSAQALRSADAEATFPTPLQRARRARRRSAPGCAGLD